MRLFKGWGSAFGVSKLEREVAKQAVELRELREKLKASEESHAKRRDYLRELRFKFDIPDTFSMDRVWEQLHKAMKDERLITRSRLLFRLEAERTPEGRAHLAAMDLREAAQKAEEAKNRSALHGTLTPKKR